MIHFLQSLNTVHIGVILGLLVALGQYFFDKKKLSAKEDDERRKINYLIVKFSAVMVPLFTVLLKDPTFNQAVAGYLPTAAAFFAAYQGIYIAMIGTWRKVQNLEKLVQEQVSTSTPFIGFSHSDSTAAPVFTTTTGTNEVILG